ncbi:MAG: hypothetical protein SFX73_22120, partial [Kofleriaceae bacterium]|nr:hypothetical protein [Kofleriaceae bacterium]
SATWFQRAGASWTMEGTSEGRLWRYHVAMHDDCGGHGELIVTGGDAEDQTLSVHVTKVHHEVLQ